MTALATSPHSAAGGRWLSRVSWASFAVVLAAFAVAALANMQSGMHGDPRTTNPNPPEAPYPPFLGVDNWPVITAVIPAVLTLCLLGVLAWLSVRQRRMHWAAIVGLAAFFAGALDPLANWATFTVFDPRVAHFPVSWPYVNAAPLLEPTLAFLGGYASYYLLIGLGLLIVYRRFVEPRISPDTWWGQHRLFAVFVTGFILGLPLNALIQFLWLRVGLFVYTEATGPVLRVGHNYLPLVMVVYDSVLFAMMAVLCVRDDHGELTLVARLTRRLPSSPGRPRLTSGRQVVVAVVLLAAIVALPIGVFSALRVGGFAKPAYDKFPYPAVKVYDPYGDLERAGKPGPFYR